MGRLFVLVNVIALPLGGSRCDARTTTVSACAYLGVGLL